MSIGFLHAHIERCIAIDPLGILRNPFTIGDFKVLMDKTKIILVDSGDVEEISLGKAREIQKMRD